VKILLVDDEKDILSSLKVGLTRNGFEVDAYNEPQKALADFKPNTYDLLILDSKMPKMSGLELYREIRKKDVVVNIFILTAFEISSIGIEQFFPDLKIQNFIQKPIALAQLVEKIKSYIKN
jgi:DNA-binding response OmpR family regulator